MEPDRSMVAYQTDAATAFSSHTAGFLLRRRFIVRCSGGAGGASLAASSKASTGAAAYKSASISCQSPSALAKSPPETIIRMSGHALTDLIVSISRRTSGACFGAVP